jgi:outer membrane lipopolysaccharide assembly protein LptE/RlpB
MNPIATVVCTAIILTAVLSVGGCGYTQEGSAPTGGYQWKSLYREDVHTVAVPIFTNRTFYRGVEFGLTKAIINQLEAQSPYKVVPKERADTILIGSIENVHVRTLSLAQNGAVIPQEQLLVMNVNFTWKDLRTGKILRERKEFEQTAPYYPTLGETQFLAQQQSAEILALAIVRELQAEW